MLLDERKILADTLRMYANYIEQIDVEAERTEDDKAAAGDIIYTAVRCAEWLKKYAGIEMTEETKSWLQTVIEKA